MTVIGVQSWVTSAVEDESVDKALRLAGSLRRVFTAKKLAVLTASTVSEKLREKLKRAFDLVVLLEQRDPRGLDLGELAKVEAFNLVIFSKCVYLSPNTLVLRNCDDIFERYSNFAALDTEHGVDPSVYLFVPSLEDGHALENIAHSMNSTEDGGFAQALHLWIQNHIPNWEMLDGKYNVPLTVKDDGSMKLDLGSEVSILNFGNKHFSDLAAYHNEMKRGLGVSEASMLSPPLAYKSEPIAIVGMSFRLPGGNDVKEFWDLLISGKEAIQLLPRHRWTREHTTLPCQNRNVEAGFLSVPLDEFDTKFFGISGKEAEYLDPQQRLLHEVVWESLEDAMIDPHSLRGSKTGIFVGSWLNDYNDMVSRATDPDFFRVYMGNSVASGAARLSHFLETTGPSIGTESGCSSAMVSVDMACKSLRNHDSDLALACGVNLILHPFDQKFLDFLLAPDGRCKTFDAGANGFGRAEGCAVLLMKRLSDATRDGDNIWGLIRGTAITQEGVSKSLGTPTVHCESLAMELALKDADVNPNLVSFIETHGTGTPVGDPLEIAAIAKIYSTRRPKSLVIGSVKTNVGHTESVSGITGIIKVLLSMKNEQIPPHLNLNKLNPAINLDAIPALIPLEIMPWPREPSKPRIAGVSSFGISGTDGHAIIQEPPEVSIMQNNSAHVRPRPLHIMKISAKSQESLQELLARYEMRMSTKDGPVAEFANLAYSANVGRSTFNHRAVIIATDSKQAVQILKDKSFKKAEIKSTGGRLCFLFTGQGSQYAKMAATLYHTSVIFRDQFDNCDHILKQKYGIHLRKILWGHASNGAELSKNLYSQTSIFCVEYCLLQLWESWGVRPDYVIGHSLGEFAAAVAVGALCFEDALMLVAERSRLIDDLPQGKMVVVQADKKVVSQHITKFKEINPQFRVDYAAFNSPEQTVLAGDSAMIDDFASFCEKNSAKTVVLAATHAFHSHHMEPILEAYRKVAQSVKPTTRFDTKAPKYVSGMEGQIVDLESINSEYWVPCSCETFEISRDG